MNTLDLKQRLRSVFRSVFSDEGIEIDESTTASDIARWDSLSHIHLILAIEKEFSVRFTTREVRSLNSVGDLIRMIEQKSS